MYAPVILFVYNRPSHTEKTVTSLLTNESAIDTDLFIYSDFAKSHSDLPNVSQVRSYIKSISGFKKITIIERESNYGLSKNIINGVSDVLKAYKTCIVIEDDLVVSKYFLRFMNKMLVGYQNNLEIGMISGHMFNIKNLPDIFFLRVIHALAWGIWSDRWFEINFDAKMLRKKISQLGLDNEFNLFGSYDFVGMLDGKIMGENDSWAVQAYASFFLSRKLMLCPGKSLVQHIGFDLGTHCHGATKPSDMDGFVDHNFQMPELQPVLYSEAAAKKVSYFLQKQKPSFLRRFYGFLKKKILSYKGFTT